MPSPRTPRWTTLLILPTLVLMGQLKSDPPVKPGPDVVPAEDKSPLPKRPNIIFIMPDDMGAADLGVDGQTAYPTPNIDQLAKEGMRFTQAYAGCTVCAPSRCVLMTGLHTGHTAVRANTGGIPLRDTDVTIAQVLKRVGYTCGGFGKWGLGEVGTDGVPEKHGFDVFFGYYNQVHAHSYYPPFLYRNSERVMLPGNEGFYGVDPQLDKAAAKFPIGAYPSNDTATGKKRQFSGYAIFSEMLKFIRENKDHPFFCYAPLSMPHGLYHMPLEDPAWDFVKDKPWPTDVKVYAAMNMIVDRQVGEVMALLKELDIDGKTIVIFTSDNGGAARHDGTLNSVGNLRGQKMTLYEGGLRVPFIARWPRRIDPGAVTDHITSFVDVFPTLADLAEAGEGLSVKLDGFSLLPQLLGPTRLPNRRQAEHEYLYWEFGGYKQLITPPDDLHQAIRMDKWKAVKPPHKPVELYDLSTDASEATDVAALNPYLMEKIASLMNASHKNPPPQVEPQKPEGLRWR